MQDANLGSSHNFIVQSYYFTVCTTGKKTGVVT